MRPPAARSRRRRNPRSSRIRWCRSDPQVSANDAYRLGEWTVRRASGGGPEFGFSRPSASRGLGADLAETHRALKEAKHFQLARRAERTGALPARLSARSDRLPIGTGALILGAVNFIGGYIPLHRGVPRWRVGGDDRLGRGRATTDDSHAIDLGCGCRCRAPSVSIAPMNCAHRAF